MRPEHQDQVGLGVGRGVQRVGDRSARRPRRPPGSPPPPGRTRRGRRRAVDDHGAAVGRGGAGPACADRRVTAGVGPVRPQRQPPRPGLGRDQPEVVERRRPTRRRCGPPTASGCHRPPSRATVMHPSRHSRIARPRSVDRRMGQLASPRGDRGRRPPGPPPARRLHHGRQRALGGAPRPSAHRRSHRGRGEPGPPRAGRRQARHRLAHRVRLLHRELGAPATEVRHILGLHEKLFGRVAELNDLNVRIQWIGRPFDSAGARTPKYVQRAIRKAIADTAATPGWCSPSPSTTAPGRS